jgi:hypothetical protein
MNAPSPRALVSYAGALGGIALWRYVTIVRPPAPWPTATMGPTFVGLVAAGAAAPSALAWSAALLARRLAEAQARGQAAGVRSGSGAFWGSSSGSGGGGAYAAAVAALAAAVATGAVARLRPGLGARGGSGKAGAGAPELRVPLVGRATSSWSVRCRGRHSSACNSGSDSLGGSGGCGEEGACGREGELMLAMAAGRPDLELLLEGWLREVAGERAPGATAAARVAAATAAAGGGRGGGGSRGGKGPAGAPLRADVFGMGPPGVVAAARAACDVLNWGKGPGARRGGGLACSLQFVQKTQAL